jgi:hypothetical protein
MSNEKTEFVIKGIPGELTVDNGNGYQTKDVLRGDNKSSKEREAVRTKKELDNNDAFIGKTDKEG